MTLPFSLSAALRRRAVGAAALALVLGLGACATTGPQTPEDEVRARAAHPHARILPWQAARMLTIIDKFAADRRTGAAS